MVNGMDEFYEELDKLYEVGNQGAIESFIIGTIGKFEYVDEQRSLTCASIYNELAGFYRGVSRYAESADAFLTSLSIFEENGYRASSEYATILLNLAGLRRLTGDIVNAIELFLTAKDIFESAGAKDTYAYISTLNNIALAYKESGDYDQALAYAAGALDHIRQSGDDHDIATSLNNLAAIYLETGDLSSAGDLISEAFVLYDRMPEKNVHYAAALSTKASLLYRAGDYIGALANFRRALDWTNRFFGENIEFAICKRNISDVLEQLGDIHAAVIELSYAAAVMDRILGAEHPSVIETRRKLEQWGTV